jgi:hypothetical protein
MSEYDDDGMCAVPPRPRRLWKVQDTKLPLYPTFFPRPNATSSCAVTDVIADCLRRWLVVVEYDEETCTAAARMTVDRCVFQIRCDE